jgi:hypothetical protein
MPIPCGRAGPNSIRNILDAIRRPDNILMTGFFENGHKADCAPIKNADLHCVVVFNAF